MIMKKIFFFFLCILLFAGSSLAQPRPLRDGEKIDAVIAVVGKYPVLKSTIETQLIIALGNKSGVSPDTIARLREQILQTEIDQKVLLVRAEQDSQISTNESEIDESLEARNRPYEQKFG